MARIKIVPIAFFLFTLIYPNIFRGVWGWSGTGFCASFGSYSTGFFVRLSGFGVSPLLYTDESSYGRITLAFNTTVDSLILGDFSH